MSVGEDAVFTIEASGCCLTYEWQRKKVDGGGYTSVHEGKTFKIENATAGDLEYMYRCRVTSGTVVSGGGEALSNEVTLRVGKCIHQMYNNSIMSL